jgi:pimeloyl-ACP methyl ester carboxylesterase
MNRLMLNCLPADDREKLYPELQSASGLQAREISMPWVQGIPVKVNPGAVPVCVAFGTEDKITPPVIAEGVAAKYSAKQLPYSGRGHMLTIEPGWENVARDVLAWLEGATSRRGNRTGSN